MAHSVEVLLNSHHIQNYSVSVIASHEFFLLSGPHVIISRGNHLNAATLLALTSDETPHDCMILTNQLLSPRIDLKEIPVTNADVI